LFSLLNWLVMLYSRLGCPARFFCMGIEKVMSMHDLY